MGILFLLGFELYISLDYLFSLIPKFVLSKFRQALRFYHLILCPSNHEVVKKVLSLQLNFWRFDSSVWTQNLGSMPLLNSETLLHNFALYVLPTWCNWHVNMLKITIPFLFVRFPLQATPRLRPKYLLECLHVQLYAFLPTRNIDASFLKRNNDFML